MKKLIFSLLFASLLAHADPTVDSNTEARKTALDTLSQNMEGRIEADYLKLTLARLSRLGIIPGPFCMQIKTECYTQAQLRYRRSEYYALGELKDLMKAGVYTSLARARYPEPADLEAARAILATGFVSELALLYAIELQEKLQLNYLRAYGVTHPNKEMRVEGDKQIWYVWAINDQGVVFEDEQVYSSSDSQ